MGTWGTGIFSDDLACDVRESWRDLLAAGVPAEEASARVEADYASSLAEPTQRSVVWLALGLSQWESGRLVERVRDAALGVIEDGSDLSRWPDGPSRDERQQVLAAARARLVDPQRPPSTPRPRGASSSGFAPGDVICYRHPAGPHFLLWVSHQHADRGGRYDDVDVLDLVGEPPFELTEVAGLRTMRGWDQFDHSRPQELRFVLVDAKKLAPARTEVIGSTVQRDRRPDAPRIGVPARDLDDWLRPFLPGGDRILRRLRPPAP